MTTTTLSLTESTRLNPQNLDIVSGLPPLPHIFKSSGDELTPEQQEANLLHVALWIIERDQKNLDMLVWHRAWWLNDEVKYRTWCEEASYQEGFHSCGTTHCLAGFAQAMAGEEAFALTPLDAGRKLLGSEAAMHFNDFDRVTALEYLKGVIAFSQFLKDTIVH